MTEVSNQENPVAAPQVDEALLAAAKELELKTRREQLMVKVLALSLDSTADSSYIRRLLCATLTIDADTANELIIEYKRFIVIAGTAEHPCSPSAMVDEVWHLHVSEDSANYYGELCSSILERIVFHEPRRKAACDPSAIVWAEKFKAAYESTFGVPMNPRFWQ